MSPSPLAAFLILYDPELTADEEGDYGMHPLLRYSPFFAAGGVFIFIICAIFYCCKKCCKKKEVAVPVKMKENEMI